MIWTLWIIPCADNIYQIQTIVWVPHQYLKVHDFSFSQGYPNSNHLPLVLRDLRLMKVGDSPLYSW